MNDGPLSGLRAALALLTVVELVIFLDVSIVNVALPSMARSLALSGAGLAWVVTAYQLTFGGFQLVGGRAADLLGRRRMFRLGLGTFTGASLLAGMAPWAWVLIASRALQGVGAAMVVPAELSLLTVMFTERGAYQRAFGVWSAMGAAGAASGVALGGILTQQAGWPWIFLVNVPIGVTALALSGRYLAADAPLIRFGRGMPRRLDLNGALTGTAAILILVYLVSVTPQRGWDDAVVIVGLVMFVALLVGFLATEKGNPDALLPLRLFNVRNVSGSAISNFLVGAAHVPAFVLLSLYFQDVLHYSAMVAGFGVLPIALVNIAVSRTILPRILDRFGPRPLLAGGFILLTVGLAVLGRAPVSGSYARDVLPGALVFAMGLPSVFVGSTLPAVKSVAESNIGVVSGIVNTTQRVGASVGVSVLLALATLRSSHVTDGSRAAALDAGYQVGFLAAAALSAVGVVVALGVLTQQRVEEVLSPGSTVLPALVEEA
jgi:EmrB/QacA subfamily drug resistance transporter